MRKYILIAAAVILFAAPCFAADILSDGFESGDLSSPSGTTGSWGGSNYLPGDLVEVSTDYSHSGSHALKFVFFGDSADSQAEQRISLGAQYGEVWGRMWLRIPSNFDHPEVDPNNNKLWAIYASPYESYTTNYQVNLSYNSGNGTNSYLNTHVYNMGAETSTWNAYTSMITPADEGQWMEIIIHMAPSTTGSSGDGIYQVWKNGTLIVNWTNLNSYGNSANYIDAMYLLGWSNSGFVETTVFYIDDVLISDTEILPGGVTPSTGSSMSGTGSLGMGGTGAAKME